VIPEATATTRFSVLARQYDQFSLRLVIDGHDPLVLPFTAPE
jgi:hypothetical protein